MTETETPLDGEADATILQFDVPEAPGVTKFEITLPRGSQILDFQLIDGRYVFRVLHTDHTDLDVYVIAKGAVNTRVSKDAKHIPTRNGGAHFFLEGEPFPLEKSAMAD